MTDEHCVEEVISSIKGFGWSPLWVTFHSELQEGEINLKICNATVSTPEMAVFDAFIVNGGGEIRCCNTDMFPTINDAVAYHLGMLIMGGNYSIIPKQDGSN